MFSTPFLRPTIRARISAAAYQTRVVTTNLVPVEEDDVEDNQNTNYWDDLVQDNALEAIVFGVLFDVTKADESICGGSADSHDDEPVVDTIEQWAAEYFRTTIGIAAVHGSAEGND